MKFTSRARPGPKPAPEKAAPEKAASKKAPTAPPPSTAQPPATPARQPDPPRRRTRLAALLRGLIRGLVILVGFVCMVGFAIALAKVTLVPSYASQDLTHTNLHPGDTLRTYLDQPEVRETIRQIGGNLLLGVPFGVLLPVLMPRMRGLLRVGLLTALVMLAVETAQGTLVTGRAFDIDDVILNTAGSLLGYLLLGRRLGRALHPPRRRWWHRRSKEGGAAERRRGGARTPVHNDT
jgi:VanZ family protein